MSSQTADAPGYGAGAHVIQLALTQKMLSGISVFNYESFSVYSEGTVSGFVNLI